ncbi:MAG: DUF302 domain-containing protein [Gammaproteobacteria bacterium]|nr:DUF302 domain-containing protein [Gammaproteobacteria bacterium]
MKYAIGAVPKRLLCLMLLGFAVALNAQDNDTRIESEDTRHIKSKHSVELTVERAKRIAEHSELKVFGVIDHARNAADVGLELLPAQLMVFGNPVVGTELMNANPLIGLDLPLKLLVWEDPQGVVWISYSSAEAMQKRHNLQDYAEQFQNTEQLLKDLGQKAGQ